jgi:hypothetical protein
MTKPCSQKWRTSSMAKDGGFDALAETNGKSAISIVGTALRPAGRRSGRLHGRALAPGWLDACWCWLVRWFGSEQ